MDNFDINNNNFYEQYRYNNVNINNNNNEIDKTCEMDDLCNLMSETIVEGGETGNDIEIDRSAEVINYGRKINHHLNNFNVIGLEQKRNLLFEIKTLFNYYKLRCFMNSTPIDQEFTNDNRNRKRYIVIREYLTHFLQAVQINSFTSHEIKQYLILARKVFIQLYFIMHETGVDSNDLNIFNYEQPITFYEYDIVDLVETMQHTSL